MLSTFETAGAYVLATQIPVRYAVRQVLDQALQKTIAAREAAARQARFKAGGTGDDTEFNQETLSDDKENSGQKKLSTIPSVVKKDFFGRVIVEKVQPLHDTDGNGGQKRGKPAEERKVWVTFHEGLNNAVRKPLALEEFLRGL